MWWGPRQPVIGYTVLAMMDLVADEATGTLPRRHITGTTALNIPQRRISTGDWRQHATWFWHEPETLSDHSLTDEPTYGHLLQVPDPWGLRDARWGRAQLGHPAGTRTEPIWAATHDRAVVEEGWESVVRQAESGVDLPPLDHLAAAEAAGLPGPVDPAALAGLAAAGGDDREGA